MTKGWYSLSPLSSDLRKFIVLNPLKADFCCFNVTFCNPVSCFPQFTEIPRIKSVKWRAVALHRWWNLLAMPRQCMDRLSTTGPRFKSLTWEFTLVPRFFYIIGEGRRIAESNFDLIEGWLNDEASCTTYTSQLSRQMQWLLCVSRRSACDFV